MTDRPKRVNHRKDRQLRAAYRTHAHTINQPCNICGQPIDYTLTHPNPQAWTLEHIQPYTLGGQLRDWANFASAHMVCQNRQGNQLARNKRNPSSRRWHRNQGA